MPKANRTPTSHIDRQYVRALSHIIDMRWLRNVVPRLIRSIHDDPTGVIVHFEQILIEYAVAHDLEIRMPIGEGSEVDGVVYSTASFMTDFRPVRAVLIALISRDDADAARTLVRLEREATPLATIIEDDEMNVDNDTTDSDPDYEPEDDETSTESDTTTDSGSDSDSDTSDDDDDADDTDDGATSPSPNTTSTSATPDDVFVYPGTGSPTTPINLLVSPPRPSVTGADTSTWAGLADVYNRMNANQYDPSHVDLISPPRSNIIVPDFSDPRGSRRSVPIDLISPSRPGASASDLSGSVERNRDEDESDSGSSTATPASSAGAVAGTSPSERDANFSPRCDSPIRRPGCYSFRSMRPSVDPLDHSIPPPILCFPAVIASASDSGQISVAGPSPVVHGTVAAGGQPPLVSGPAAASPPVVYGPPTASGEPPSLPVNVHFASHIRALTREDFIPSPRTPSPIPDIPPQSSPTDSDLALDAALRFEREGWPLQDWIERDYSGDIRTPRLRPRSLPDADHTSPLRPRSLPDPDHTSPPRPRSLPDPDHTSPLPPRSLPDAEHDGDEYVVDEWLNKVDYSKIDALRLPPAKRDDEFRG